MPDGILFEQLKNVALLDICVALESKTANKPENIDRIETALWLLEQKLQDKDFFAVDIEELHLLALRCEIVDKSIRDYGSENYLKIITTWLQSVRKNLSQVQRGRGDNETAVTFILNLNELLWSKKMEAYQPRYFMAG